MTLSNNIDLIQQIARLIYCAGMIDGDFSRIEKEESLKVINQLSEEEFGRYSEDLMIKEIADLVENRTSTDELITDFKNYYYSNLDLFHEEEKYSILKLLDRVMYSQARRNKSELIFLSQLEMLFFGKLI
jgi:hypothetical protein